MFVLLLTVCITSLIIAGLEMKEVIVDIDRKVGTLCSCPTILSNFTAPVVTVIGTVLRQNAPVYAQHGVILISKLSTLRTSTSKELANMFWLKVLMKRKRRLL